MTGFKVHNIFVSFIDMSCNSTQIYPHCTALRRSHVETAIRIMKLLQECSTDVKAVNLRGVINSGMGEVIFRRTGNQIRRWIDEGGTGLSSEEDLRLMAKIMRIQGHKTWYNPNDKGD